MFKLFNIPIDPLALLLALALQAGFIGLSIGTLLVARRFPSRFQYGREDADLGQIFGGAIGTMFALVFALVTIAVWDNYSRAASGVSDEANCLYNIHSCLQAYPRGLREPGNALLDRYLRSVVEEEWPLMRKGRQDPKAGAQFMDFSTMILAYRPAPAELPLHAEMLGQLSRYRNLRHDRIKAGEPYLDTCMWVSLAGGSLVLIGFCALFRMDTLRQHLLLMVPLGASLGVIFFLILAYNHPFTDPGPVDSGPFQALLADHWSPRGQ